MIPELSLGFVSAQNRSIKTPAHDPDHNPDLSEMAAARPGS
jgi:hypothetical protein